MYMQMLKFPTDQVLFPKLYDNANAKTFPSEYQTMATNCIENDIDKAIKDKKGAISEDTLKYTMKHNYFQIENWVENQILNGKVDGFPADNIVVCTMEKQTKHTTVFWEENEYEEMERSETSFVTPSGTEDITFSYRKSWNGRFSERQRKEGKELWSGNNPLDQNLKEVSDFCSKMESGRSIRDFSKLGGLLSILAVAFLVICVMHERQISALPIPLKILITVLELADTLYMFYLVLTLYWIAKDLEFPIVIGLIFSPFIYIYQTISGLFERDWKPTQEDWNKTDAAAQNAYKILRYYDLWSKQLNTQHGFDTGRAHLELQAYETFRRRA